MRRVVVYGVAGSGKSTLARAIGERTGLPYHPVDDLTWEPGWTPVPLPVQRERIAAICAGDAWVLDSAYLPWLDVPMARADLVVGLDLPRWRCLWQLLRRTVHRAVTRTPICNGNVESLRAAFGRNSIVLQQWRSWPRKRARMRAWQTDPGMPPLLLLRTPGEVRAWLASL
ncbi:adenylate kinase [Actinoplanes oblitus]|uniref:Adenylate kinase n=1 Tax=Actinoplanes oblitus TaxID=3040509 RepID=A0ABY8W6N5_9ACTN|nr:adenylate kinase [Actinoplanes oblitus]WIM92615.1 adenylate kinase [Actinoplanes oblitus]